LSGKEFIYRGLELEKRDDFIERAKKFFPKAEILSYADQPPNDIVQGAGQYLQITPVKAASLEEIEGKPSRIPDAMPFALQKYYQGNDVNVFVFSKPFKKLKTKDENEFKDLWIKNTYYITEDSFPTVHRRSPIVRVAGKELSPVENAYKAIKDKNKELRELLVKYDDADKTAPAHFQEFTMVLQGVINAAVNGGPEKYADAFFSATFQRENPDKQVLVKALREELAKQLEITEQGMALHKRRCGPDMVDLHALLEGKLVEMREHSKAIQT